MSEHIEATNTSQPEILTLKDLAKILIRHKGLNEGLYNLSFRFEIAVGAVGPTPDAMVPGAMFGVSGVGLEKVPVAGPLTVDAAIVNPVPHPKHSDDKPVRSRRSTAKAKPT
jgi:hypothetical protein